MIRDLLKWIVPGLATVLGGTTLCLAMTSSDIASDLAAQSASTVERGAYDWAELSFDMRDVTLTGTTTDQNSVDALASRLASIPGIRNVTTSVTLAPTASPYVLVASLDNNGISLDGGVPDEATRQHLLSRAGIEQAELDLRSGMPERKTWISGADFAIDQLKYLDQGQITVSDLTVSLVGRAKSARDFRDLLIVMRAGAPAGVTLGKVEITPALVSPYEWSATSDGTRIDVTGFVPNDSLAERLRTADVGSLPVATGLALGSGEPAGFAELSQKLIEQLARLEYGSASITDGVSTLSGAPPTEEVAQAIVTELGAAGSIIVLDPPRIDDYWVSATRQPGGATVFDGYAPDEATRDALGQRQDADISWLKLGRGAPERYQSAVDFGLAALDQMSEGRFALRGDALTLSGIARSAADYDALLTTVAASAPQGLVLATAEILPPRASRYAWSATKQPTGLVILSGFVPNEDAKANLLHSAGDTATETMTYASGEPGNFLASAQTGLALLQWLSDGEVNFDGSAWLVTGTAKTGIDKGAIEADFVTRKLASSGWSMAIAEPPPTIPYIAPYVWSATRSDDGTVVLAGHVPTAPLQRFLAVHAGEGVTDTTELGRGAPEDFVPAATAALDAVLALEQASVSFDGSVWTLIGKAPTAEARDTILAALAGATDTSAWAIDIAAPEPMPVATVPYTWSATKSADGAVTLAGLVPADALQRFVAVRAGDGAVDDTKVDPTAPAGFADDVLAAIDILATLSEGSVRYDGTQWSIEGTLGDVEASATIDTALAGATTPADAWQLTLLSPPPVEEPALVEPIAAEQEAIGGEPVVEAAEPVQLPDITEAPAPEPMTAEPAPAEEPAAPVAPVVNPAYAFSATRGTDGAMVLSGQLPADPASRYFAAITEGDVAAVTVAQGAPEAFLPSAEIGLRALLLLSQGQLDFVNGAWSINGTAPDAPSRDAALAAVAADGATWTTAIDVAPTATAPVAAPEPEPTPEPALPTKVDIAACGAPIADFSARNAILFQSGAAIITAESEPALDELAADLGLCPDAVIHVEGHTDADGDEQLNLALSVARAEAVVEALVERGVTPARLYAVGYGESTPIADNDTSAGKRLNRRIVVTVSDDHY